MVPVIADFHSSPGGCVASRAASSRMLAFASKASASLRVAKGLFRGRARNRANVYTPA